VAAAALGGNLGTAIRSRPRFSLVRHDIDGGTAELSFGLLLHERDHGKPFDAPWYEPGLQTKGVSMTQRFSKSIIASALALLLAGLPLASYAAGTQGGMTSASTQSHAPAISHTDQQFMDTPAQGGLA